MRISAAHAENFRLLSPPPISCLFQQPPTISIGVPYGVIRTSCKSCTLLADGVGDQFPTWFPACRLRHGSRKALRHPPKYQKDGSVHEGLAAPTQISKKKNEKKKV